MASINDAELDDLSNAFVNVSVAESANNAAQEEAVEISDTEDQQFVSLDAYEAVEDKYNINFSLLTYDHCADILLQRSFTNLDGEQTLLYDERTDSFLAFNGTYWREGTSRSYTELRRLFIGADGFIRYVWGCFKTYQIEFQGGEKQREKAMKPIISFIKRLEQSSGKTGVLKSLALLVTPFEQPTWDALPHLFAFTDAVLNLETMEMVPSSPLFYIRTTCGYSHVHPHSFDEVQAAMGYVRDFIDGLVATAEEAVFLRNILASWLHRTNISEKASFFIGEGRNGKGTLMALVGAAFGGYFGTLKLEYWTRQPKSSNATSSHLVKVANSRIVVTSEAAGAVNTDQYFLSETFKRTTGGDPLEARDPHRPAFSFVMGNVVFLTNEMVDFTNARTAILALTERIVIIPFAFSFVEPEMVAQDPTKFKVRDNTVKQRFERDPIYRYALILLLMETYRARKTAFLDGTIMHGKGTPPVVKERMHAYFAKFGGTDDALYWIENNIAQGGAEDNLDVKDVHRTYQERTGGKTTQKTFWKIVQERYGSRERTDKNSRGFFVRGSFWGLKGYLLRRPAAYEESAAPPSAADEDTTPPLSRDISFADL